MRSMSTIFSSQIWSDIFLLAKEMRLCYNISTNKCGISSLVEHQLPKLRRRVRFPYPAPDFNITKKRFKSGSVT